MFSPALLALLLFVPLSALAHPGKTDRQGGHRCFKECAEWDLYYDEYHLHDKEGRPVRIRPSQPRPAKKQEPARTEDAPPAGTPARPAPVAPGPAAMVKAETSPVVPQSALWTLLALLLGLLLARRRRSRPDRS